MNILLTGASGFIGSALLPLLLAKGHHITALTRQPIKDLPDVSSIVTGLTEDLSVLPIPWADIDVVVHLAASGVKSSRRNWPEALDFNIVGTQRLLDGIESLASRRPLFVMTRTFYEHLVDESPVLLDNPYIATKKAAADLVRLWAQKYEGTSVLATVFQVYGPGDDSANVLSYAARQITSGRVALFGSGNGLRDWIYIDDAARAILAILEAASSGRHSSILEFDIGTGCLLSIRQMVEGLVKISPSPEAKVIFDPARDRPDTGIALAAKNPPPNWFPQVTPVEGLQRVVHTLMMSSCEK